MEFLPTAEELPKVFSFQGAFASPTFGHYEAMRFFALKMLELYPNAEIIMLFMPNGAGSKPHVSFTRESRMDILRAFCDNLNAEFKDRGNITFGASDIEYWLCTSGTFTPDLTPMVGSIKGGLTYNCYTNITNLLSDNVHAEVGQATSDQGSSGGVVKHDKYGNVLEVNNTATFRTLPVLRSMFPGAKIILGMGKDNLLQSIYWKYFDIYKSVYGIEEMYAVDRVLTEKETSMSADFNDGIRLQTFMPWIFSGADIIKRFGDETTIKCGTSEVEPVASNKSYNNTCSIQTKTINADIMPRLIQLRHMPPPTSSSLMRVFIASVLCGKNDDIEKIKRIMFGLSGIDDTLQTHLVNYTLTEYSKIPSEYDKALADYKILEGVYKSKKGGRSTRKSTKPKQRRTSKKQRTHKKKKTMKRKLRHRKR